MHLPNATAHACRDWRRRLPAMALVRLGFADALRRSEFAAIDAEDLTERNQRPAVLIASPRADQEGQGTTMTIPRALGSPYGPVRTVRD